VVTAAMAALHRLRNVVVYDLATRGSKERREVTRFGAVCGDGAVFERSLKPGTDFEEVFQAFLLWLEEHVEGLLTPLLLVGRSNWASDDKVLCDEFARRGWRDPFRGRSVWSADLDHAIRAEKSYKGGGGGRRRRLADVYVHYFGAPLQQGVAAVDAQATRDLVPYFWEHLRARPFGDDRALKREVRRYTCRRDEEWAEWMDPSLCWTEEPELPSGVAAARKTRKRLRAGSEEDKAPQHTEGGCSLGRERLR
jgi:hypothetical protein